MRSIFSSTIVAGLAAIVLSGGVASAQTVTSDNAREPSRAGWMSVGEVVAKIEEQGYSVREIETDDATYEVEAVDANGARVEADLDPSTGKPLRGWKQDD